jgi:hypothetical protein
LQIGWCFWGHCLPWIGCFNQIITMPLMYTLHGYRLFRGNQLQCI